MPKANSVSESTELLKDIQSIPLGKLRERRTIARVKFGKDSPEAVKIKEEIDRREADIRKDREEQQSRHAVEQRKWLATVRVPFAESQELFNFSFKDGEWQLLRGTFKGLKASRRHVYGYNGNDADPGDPALWFVSSDGREWLEPIHGYYHGQSESPVVEWSDTLWQATIEDAFLVACRKAECGRDHWSDDTADLGALRQLYKLFLNAKASTLPGLGQEVRAIKEMTPVFDELAKSFREVLSRAESSIATAASQVGLGATN